jgi:hypothetical protein
VSEPVIRSSAQRRLPVASAASPLEDASPTAIILSQPDQRRSADVVLATSALIQLAKAFLFANEYKIQE